LNNSNLVKICLLLVPGELEKPNLYIIL